MDSIRLLIASENSSSRKGLAAIFSTESSFDVLGSFSFPEMIEKSIILQPDVVLLDLPEEISKYGQSISQLKNECPCSLIIAMVENEQYEGFPEVLAKGIDGCVPRGIVRGCLVKAVELACLAGLFYLPGYFKKVLTQAAYNKPENAPHLKSGDRCTLNNDLTRREMEILQLMVSNCSNREIADKLYISEPTVKTHVSSILRKLGQANRAQAIVYCYKNGLISEFPAVINEN